MPEEDQKQETEQQSQTQNQSQPQQGEQPPAVSASVAEDDVQAYSEPSDGSGGTVKGSTN